jgi:alpha-tubulin suppressor-like RCC1 family protein
MREIIQNKPAYNGSLVTNLSIGDDFGIVTDELGNVFGWGHNDCGQLASTEVKKQF